MGQRVDDQYVVKSGIQPGEEVVTHGNFKFDSAAKLAAKASMMNQNLDGSKPAGHNHGSMEMDTEPLIVDTGDHQHTQHLSALIESYLGIKNALANDRLEEAKTHLKTFRREETQSAEMNNHPQHLAMVETVNAGSEADNLEQLPFAFIGISDNLVKGIQNQGFDEEELYLQYCPMGDNKNGANWISESREISNPYMGQKMPNCGSTVEGLSPTSK